MTIDEAIKILNDELDCSGAICVPSIRNALLLGIEALKRVKESREGGGRLIGWLLPGETKE